MQTGRIVCSDAVRYVSVRAGSPSADPHGHPRTVSAQWIVLSVIYPGQGCAMVHGATVCKTVGSAYVGSNPTPATPAKTAPWLRKRGPAGRFLLVTACIRLCHRGSMRGSGYGHIADCVRVEQAVRKTAPFAIGRLPAMQRRRPASESGAASGLRARSEASRR